MLDIIPPESLSKQDNENQIIFKVEEEDTVVTKEEPTEFLKTPTECEETGENQIEQDKQNQNSSDPQPPRRKRPPIPCTFPGCTRVLSSKESLKHHMRIHTGEEPYECGYPGCSHRCRNVANIRSHRLLHLDRSERPRYHCTQPGCFRVYLQRSSLRDHLNVHKDYRPHVCDYPGCGRRFRQRGHLRDHRNLHLSDEERPRYLCTHPGCPKTFTLKRSLRLHMCFHLGKLPCVCQYPGCNRAYPAPGRLRIHMRCHIDKVDQPTATKRRRKAKVGRHRAKAKAYVCDFIGCGKAYAYSKLLDNHYRTHPEHNVQECKVIKEHGSIAQTSPVSSNNESVPIETVPFDQISHSSELVLRPITPPLKVE